MTNLKHLLVWAKQTTDEPAANLYTKEKTHATVYSVYIMPQVVNEIKAEDRNSNPSYTAWIPQVYSWYGPHFQTSL